MGYAFIMFGIMLMMSVVVIVANYGIEKDSQIAPLKAENTFAEREAGKVQTDIVVNATKINGTAKYTDPDNNNQPNELNLHLTIKNNGSIVLKPFEYSILLNNSWAKINSSSENITTPLNSSNVSFVNLTVTPPSKPMKAISLLVTAGNGVKIITPTSPLINESGVDVSISQSDNCYYNVSLSWLPSYGEMWPLNHYTVYYSDDKTDIIDKNNIRVGLTTDPSTSYFIGNAFRRTNVGQCSTNTTNGSIYIWVSATDTHGNEGPPSNTCSSQGVGNNVCNINRG